MNLNSLGGVMWNLDHFVADCQKAIGQPHASRAIAELIANAMASPDAVVRAVGEPKNPGITPIYKSVDLTILNLVWRPSMTAQPHDHRMWAVIGLYGGREDNIFWRRIEDDPQGRVEAAGARNLGTGDWTILGDNVIHSVTNPIPRLTGALHVYGGDFFEAERSEWDPERLEEQPLDIERVKAMFSADEDPSSGRTPRATPRP
jgi:predicted metal-dependent enzyme (double-stranded beta helix superfamily)